MKRQRTGYGNTTKQARPLEKGTKEEKQTNNKTNKHSKTNDRCSEACDARRSERKGCKKNSIRAEEEQIPVARAKQHEEEEEDTGIRQVGRQIREQTKRRRKKKE